MDRPTKYSRKLRKTQSGSYILTVPPGRIDDLGWEGGDWINFNLKTTGRLAGQVMLEKITDENDRDE